MIPERIDQKPHAKNKGQHAGRPPRFERDLDKKCDTAGRFSSKFA